ICCQRYYRCYSGKTVAGFLLITSPTLDMENLKNKISSLAKKYFQEAIEIRRHLHAHPELSYEEYETAEFIKEKLSSWAIPHQTMAKTGVIGLIEGRNPSSRIIALRADI